MLRSRVHPVLLFTTLLAGILLCATFFISGHESVKESRRISAIASPSTSSFPIVPAFAADSRSLVSAGGAALRCDRLNSSHDLQVIYQNDGFGISRVSESGNKWHLRLRLESITKGDEKLRPLAGIEPEINRVNENHLEMRHEGFTIEYVNTPEGMRQNFIVERRPSGDNALRVQLRAEGDLRPVVKGEDDAVFVRGEEKIIKYTGLKVWDARGIELPARMEATDDLLALVVDDTDAEYPVTVDPLVSDADLIWNSTVISVGDVNGDGYDDVIIGGLGQAQLFYGSATGLDSTADWISSGDQPNSGFGSGVGYAGDMNHDGYDDVLIGASRYDNGDLPRGRLFLYHGSASGLSTTPAWYQVGLSWGKGGADVNNDGYIDVMIGSSVYYGSASGLSPTSNWRPNLTNWLAEMVVDFAGDVNGDGYDDVIVGTPWYTTNFRAEEGAVFIYYGSAAGLSVNYNWMVKGNIDIAHFGASVAGAGDVNGDGYDDVIAGLPGDASYEPRRGAAYIFLGSATGPALVPGWSAGAGGAGELYGQSVAALGDVNGDGYDDVAVGAPRYGYSNYFAPGATFVYYGARTGMTGVSRRTIIGQPDAGNIGGRIATAGDVNGDGYNELIVGWYGRSYIFYGVLDTIPRTLTGVVTNHLGTPISGALVKLDGPSGRSTLTNASGRFTITLMEQGYNRLTVSATGYQTATFDLTMPNGDKHVVLGLNPTGTPPPGPFTICGTVTDTDGNGPPLNSVAVEILQGGNVVHTTSTDSQGKFCSIQLSAGTYQARFSKSGYQTFTADLKLDANKQIVVSLLPSNLQ